MLGHHFPGRAGYIGIPTLMYMFQDLGLSILHNGFAMMSSKKAFLISGFAAYSLDDDDFRLIVLVQESIPKVSMHGT